MSRIVRAFLVLALVLAAGSAVAQPKKAPAAKGRSTRVAFLPVSVKALPPEMAKKLGSTVVGELGDIGVFEVVPGKTLSDTLAQLRQKKVYDKGCEDKKPCIQAVGRGVKASVLYHLHVAKAQEGVTLTMRAFDVKSGKEVRTGSEFATEDEADLDRAARWLTRKVSSPFVTTLMKGKGKLQVNCEEGGADLYVNGKSFGKKAGTAFKVSSGVFDVVVKKEGFEAFHDVVVVRSDQAVEIKAVLKPAGESKPLVASTGPGTKPGGETAPPPPPPPPPEPDKKELPAWAHFEQPKPAPAGTQGTGTAAVKTTPEPMPWQQPKQETPFLPPGKEEKQVEAKHSSEKKFYQTWWFWTVVGVVVAGGAGTGIYFGVTSSGGGGGGTGAATVTWH